MSEFGFSYVDHDGVEMAMVGTGVGGGFVNTNVHTMTFEQAMASPDKNEWLKAVDEEYENMEENGVFQVTQTCDVPQGAKILSTTWVLKKKANGRRKGRITAQRDGEHFDATDKASPVVNDITIRIVLTLIVMAGLWAEIVDVKGAFLTAEFEPHHKRYTTVPKGFEKYYPGNVVLLLKRTLYGTCQAAIQFWKKLCRVMNTIRACVNSKLLVASWGLNFFMRALMTR
jgi:hypothetical protein